MVIELSRLERGTRISSPLVDFMNGKEPTGHGGNYRKWQRWLWQQDYEPEKSYPDFKSKLYRKIDPKFAAYFANDRKNTIRLDEVVWGGVLQDGIPPLRDPEMITPARADYLGDDDIIFGIEVDGDARAYPKRILAWHEMFTDTIQGVPLAGVY